MYDHSNLLLKFTSVIWIGEVQKIRSRPTRLQMSCFRENIGEEGNNVPSCILYSSGGTKILFPIGWEPELRGLDQL